MPGVSAYDPIDNLEQIDDPYVKYVYSKKKILEDLGLRFVGQLFFVNAEEVSGIDAEKYARGLVRLREYLTNAPGSGIDAYTLLQRSQELVRYIHTGSFFLDYILGGGIRTGLVTEFAGPYRSGKTQISLTTSIAVQLPGKVKNDVVIDVDECKLALKSSGKKFDDLSALDPLGRGLGKGAIYIDTEAAFEPSRLIPIAKRFGLDPEKALKNITVFRVTSVAEQFEAVYKAGLMIPERNVGLVVVDSLMNLFRAEFVGRERLAERQQLVNKFVHMLVRMAEIYNIGVIVTNQVMDQPEARFAGGGDEFGLKVVGGHVVAHNVGVRVMLNVGSSSKSKRAEAVTVRRAKIVDSSYLPQRECFFGIADVGVVDVNIDNLCNIVVNDYIAYGSVRGGLDRLILPPSEKKIARKLSARKAAKTRKGITTAERFFPSVILRFMRVLLAQLAPKVADVRANADRAIEVITSNEADVYVFPELFLTGYSVGDEIVTLAEEVPEALDRISEHLSGIAIIGGPEKESEGRIYNAAFVIGARRHVYRKHFLPNHLPFTEKLRFHPGRSAKAFEFRGRRFGLMICYDAFFPEIARMYLVQGVDALVTISASPFGRSVYFDTFVTARALETGAYHVYVNRVGLEGPLNFRGGSRVIAPDGSVEIMLPRLHETTELEGVAVVELDKKRLRLARMSSPQLRDLRFSPRYDVREKIARLFPRRAPRAPRRASGAYRGRSPRRP